MDLFLIVRHINLAHNLLFKYLRKVKETIIVLIYSNVFG